MSQLWTIVERVLAVIACAALACLVVLPFTQVILRDVFTAPIVGLEEATRWGLIALVFLALPLLISVNGQIRFAEAVDRLPRGLRNSLERMLMLLCAGALGVVAWAGVGSILQNTGTRTPTLDIPFWLFALPYLAGTVLTAVGYLLFALRRQPPPTGSPPPIL